MTYNYFSVIRKQVWVSTVQCDFLYFFIYSGISLHVFKWQSCIKWLSFLCSVNCPVILAILSLFCSSKEKLPAVVSFKSGQVSSKVEQNQPCAAKSDCDVLRAPAFQRHSSLAVASPPTFQLPYRYKVLGDTFQSSDTVVSMLTNRAEICTFSKLKAAVQEMTKRFAAYHQIWLFNLAMLGLSAQWALSIKC